MSVAVKLTDQESIIVALEGYGDKYSAPRHGHPILIEYDEDTDAYRVMIWSDINKEDPTHFISLAKAKESLRKDDEDGE